MTQNPNRSDADSLQTDPSAELGLRSPVRDKEKLGDEQYNTTPPREEVRPPEAPTDACTQCAAPLDRARAVRSDAKEYDYYFCDVNCRDRWHRERDGAARPAHDRHDPA